VRFTRTLLRGALVLAAATAGAQGGISGTVYDSLRSHAALANATVVLIERDRYATTDAHGRFRFDTVPDGRYTLGFTHEILDSLDLELPPVPVEVAGGRRTTVALATPSMASVYARMCPGPRDPETGVIIGRVADVDDHMPLGGATVSTDWTEFTLVGGRSAGHRVRAATRTGPRGVYLLCGVPATVLLDVQAELAGFMAGPVRRSLGERVISRADFALSQKDSAARLPPPGDSARDAAAGFRGTATLRGVVLGGDGRPVRDAVVGVLGTPQTVHTDGAGSFRIEHVPAGTRTIEVRSVGSLPMTASMDLATNGTRDTTLSISRQAQELAPVAVAGQARSTSWMDLNGFDSRRTRGLGAYVTGEEIARHGYPDVAAVLRGVRGVRVECNSTKRGPQGIPCFPMPYLLSITDLSGVHCVPNFFVDGTQFPVDGPGPPAQHPFSDLSASIPPSLVRGIEVYSSPGAIPAQFDLISSTGCGSIVIWTH